MSLGQGAAAAARQRAAGLLAHAAGVDLVRGRLRAKVRVRVRAAGLLAHAARVGLARGRMKGQGLGLGLGQPGCLVTPPEQNLS